MDHTLIFTLLPLLFGWVLDLLFGDPVRLPHPVVWFGRAIAFLEHRLNRGSHRIARGAITALSLIAAVYAAGWGVERLLSDHPIAVIAFKTIAVFYCLAGTTLRREVRMVFEAADRSLDDGRRQVSRIVGRDTEALSDREVRAAALETLAENLSDGVIAPLFYYALLGVPGMLAYKMVNTLDSMIAYHTDRYLLFGRWAARIDDIANYIPARLTALMMILTARRPGLWRFVAAHGPRHASPNSGWPEAALAGILDCRFGGTHNYFGTSFYKPHIGTNPRPFTAADLDTSLRIALLTELATLLSLVFITVLIDVSSKISANF